MAVTLADVARRAKVSISTVSNALNGTGRLSDDTRDAVLRAVAELGYRTNAHALGLRKGQTRLIGLQLGRSDVGSLLPVGQYFADILNGAAEAALEEGWLLVPIPHNAAPQLLTEIGLSRGIVVDPIGTEPIILHLAKNSGYLVTTGSVSELAAGVAARTAVVDNDLSLLVPEALRYLRSSGYTAPALLTSRSSASYVRETIREFEAWGREQRIDVLIAQVEGMNETSAMMAALQMLSGANRPDCIYTTSEDAAVGALRAASDLSLEVPHDVGVFAAIDGHGIRFSSPPISGVNLNPTLLGEASVRRLLCLAAGKPTSNEAIPFSIIPRLSTARANVRRVGGRTLD